MPDSAAGSGLGESQSSEWPAAEPLVFSCNLLNTCLNENILCMYRTLEQWVHRDSETSVLEPTIGRPRARGSSVPFSNLGFNSKQQHTRIGKETILEITSRNSIYFSEPLLYQYFHRICQCNPKISLHVDKQRGKASSQAVFLFLPRALTVRRRT